MIILEQANHIVESTLKERFALAKEGYVGEALESEPTIDLVLAVFWLTPRVCCSKKTRTH
jgi:hypothetical protein